MTVLTVFSSCEVSGDGRGVVGEGGGEVGGVGEFKICVCAPAPWMHPPVVTEYGVAGWEAGSWGCSYCPCRGVLGVLWYLLLVWWKRGCRWLVVVWWVMSIVICRDLVVCGGEWLCIWGLPAEL